MKQQLPYEEIIAAKLQQVSLPDMADSIWASIEMKLDNGLPDMEITKPSSPGGGAPAAPGMFFYVLIGAFLISALVWVFNKKDYSKIEKPGPSIADSVVNRQEADTGSMHNKKYLRGTDDRMETKPERKRLDQDSPTFQDLPSIPKLNMDSTHLPSLLSIRDSAGNHSGPPVRMVDSLPVKKTQLPTQKGVPGISEDDYKIKTSKKDSLKQ